MAEDSLTPGQQQQIQLNVNVTVKPGTITSPEDIKNALHADIKAYVLGLSTTPFTVVSASIWS